jgi:hypothetical protein
LSAYQTNADEANSSQPSATGQNWEKYQKNFADEEIEEKKITPLTDEYVDARLQSLVGSLLLTQY